MKSACVAAFGVILLRTVSLRFGLASGGSFAGLRRVRTHAISLALACAATLASGEPARAQSSGGKVSSDTLEYNRTIEQAVERFRERDFDRARELFEEAHALDPSARTLRGLGLTDFESGRYAEAIRELEAAMIDPRKPLDPQQRSEVQAVIAHARGFVGTLRVRVAPSDAAITLDDKPLRGESVTLDSGSYVVRAEAPGHVTTEQVVQIVPGDVSVATLTLPPLASEPAHAPVDEYDGTQQTAAWIVGSVGVAGVIVGSVFGVRSLVKHDESDRYCGDDGLCDDLRGVTAMDDARAAGDVSTVAFVVGGLALGVATVLLLTAPDRDSFPRETARLPDIRLGPGAIQVNGVF